MNQTALVVGGSGPTGQQVVRGLVERGFDVSVFHTGAHEVEHPAAVRHIHGDPHFQETIADSLGDAGDFDVVIAQYGRLRYLVDFLGPRTRHLIAIGSAGRIIASPENPRWPAPGKPAIVPEAWIAPTSEWLEDQPAQKLSRRVVESYQHLFAMSEQVGFAATYLGYPVLYGPLQPGCREWSVVRRILDGRSSFILADGGLKVESRAFTENAAQAPLLVVDQLALAAGRTYVVTDEYLHTQRQRVEFIAAYLGHHLELVDLPWEQAVPAHPFFGHVRHHRATTSQQIRAELGFRDHVDAATALARTVDWLMKMPADGRAELEGQLGDPFDYAKEDQMIAAWSSARDAIEQVGYETAGYAHIYRHPRAPNEQWARPNQQR